MIEITGLDEYEDLIQAMPAIALEAGAAAMTSTLLFLHGKLPEYPAGQAPQGQTVKNMSAKARAWFFANLRKGTLRLPYRRTLQLGRSFTTETTVQGTAVLGEIGTNAAHAPWVVGADFPGETIRGRSMYQAKIHAGRWWQFGDVIEANRAAALDYYQDEFGREFTARIQAQP